MKIDMRIVHVKTMEHMSLQEMTELWNRCWFGYYYDMSYSQELMKVWLDLSQVSLRHSVAIIVNHKIVGFTLLSVEGREGWIAGTCIDPEYRRNGLFRVLMSTQLNLAKSLYLKRVYLEVLEQNHARTVYQSVGFKKVRQLNVYRTQLKSRSRNGILRSLPLETVSLEHYFIKRSHAYFNPTWQRREGYLRRHNNLTGLITPCGTAGALFAGEKSSTLIDIWSSDLEGAEVLLSIVLQESGESLSLTNQPYDWISTSLSAFGFRPSAKQIEMYLELS